MKAMIMSAGNGTRVRPLSYDTPKPMFAIANKPVLHYALKLLKKHNIREAMINLGPHSGAIENHFKDGSACGVNINYSRERSLLGTAGAIKKVERYFNDTFVVMSGDGLTDVNLAGAVKYHKSKKAFATIVLKRVDSRFKYGIALTASGGRIKEFVEKPSWSEVFHDTVNTGIYILEPEIMDYIPKNKYYDFGTQLWSLLLKKKKRIFGYEMKGYWCDIGDLGEYRKAQRDVLSGKVKIALDGKKKGVNIRTGSGTKIERGAKIKGPCIIGRNCTIRSKARIDGYSVIGDGSVVGENAVITGSTLWQNVRVGGNVVIRNSILGNGARISGKSCIIEESIIRNKQSTIRKEKT